MLEKWAALYTDCPAEKTLVQSRARPDSKEEIRRRATIRQNCLGWEEHAPTEELVGTAEISGEH
jgi:hypothetical protein